MALTILSGTAIKHWGVFGASDEALGPITGTATQTVSLTHQVTAFTGPTATVTNRYTLAAGVEGQMKLFVYDATGTGGGTTASGGDIQVALATTGLWQTITFREVDEYWLGQYIDGAWRCLSRTTGEWAQTTGATASGAIPLSVDLYRFGKATGTDQVFSLANGYTGQEIFLTALTGTCVRTVTPTNMHKFTSVQMGNTTTTGATGTRSALLKYMAGAWAVVSALNLNTTGTLMDENGVIVT